MLTVEELKKSKLIIRRKFEVKIDNIITKYSEEFKRTKREEVQITFSPRLDIMVMKGGYVDYFAGLSEADCVACLSVEQESYTFYVGTKKEDYQDWESESMCYIEKISFFEQGKNVVFYDDLWDLSEDDKVRNEYDCFFNDLLYEYADEYQKNYFKFSGCEEYSMKIGSELMQALFNEKDEEKRRVLAELLKNNF